MHNCENWTEHTFEEAERAIGYTFREKDLLLESFTHSTYVNCRGGQSNERLEFLGDAVLELVVSERLYLENPEAQEGALTELRQKYVLEEALRRFCERAGLIKFLRYSGKENDFGVKTIASLPEAVIGAIYLDGGKSAAEEFIWRFLTQENFVNYKQKLQNLVQEKAPGTLPTYRTRQEGELHISTVSALGKSAQGSGKDDTAAEMSAAKSIFEELTKGERN